MPGKKSAAGKRKAAGRWTSSSDSLRSIATSPILQAALQFVAGWEKKKVNKTIELEELVDYLGILPRSGRRDSSQANETENAVRLMTVHGAKGLEFPHVFILRANFRPFPAITKRLWSHFPGNFAIRIPLTEADDKTLHNRKSAVCSMWR